MSKYLSSDVPESGKRAKKVGSSSDGKYTDFEKELAEIKEQLTIQNRDNLDSMYNIGVENFDTTVQEMISETENSIASLKVSTTANAASIEAFAQWKDGTGTDSLAGVIAEATKDFATIAMLANYTTTDDVNGLITSAKAGIIADAQEGMATLSMIAAVTDTDGDVTAASIVAAVNDSKSSVKIDADHVDISGFVTFTDLANGNGATQISGNLISLLADENGNSDGSWTYNGKTINGSSIEFMNYNSYYDDYFTMARLITRDNGSSSADQSRFAFVIKTNRTRIGSDKYDTALKLEATGSISLETSGGMIYAESYGDTYMCASHGIIRFAPSYFGGDVSLNSGEYSFCSDGIYYGSTCILSV